MSNNLAVFNNPDFGSIRTVTVNNEPYFVGKDIADILGYANASKAVLAHVDEEDKTFLMLDIADSQNGNLPVGQSKTALINESGLYSLILSSRLPNAKKFKRWVTNEVLPAIRQNGGYIMDQENLSDSELLAKAVLVAQKTIANKDKIIEQQKAKIEQDKPKTIFADAVAASHTSILIGELAKLLKQNGIETGQRRLFAWLRENGYLIKTGSSKNMPTQRAMELGLFEIKEGSYINGAGVNVTTKTTKVTGKGQQYFINKFLAP